MLWNYYCAQFKFNASQRSSINPNLTCICSQFGRGNRPRSEETARDHAHKKSFSSMSRDLGNCLTLLELWTCRNIAGTSCLLPLPTDLPWPVLHSCCKPNLLYTCDHLRSTAVSPRLSAPDSRLRTSVRKASHSSWVQNWDNTELGHQGK